MFLKRGVVQIQTTYFYIRKGRSRKSFGRHNFLDLEFLDSIRAVAQNTRLLLFGILIDRGLTVVMFGGQWEAMANCGALYGEVVIQAGKEGRTLGCVADWNFRTNLRRKAAANATETDQAVFGKLGRC